MTEADCNDDVSPSRAGDRPRISVVVATWQAADTLDRCIKSVLEQRYPGKDLLIVDAGSSDDTVSIIRRFESGIAWWISEPDAGIYDAWNKAIPRTRGDYICFIGADDAFADPEALCRLVSAIGSERPDLVTSKGRFVDRETGREREYGSAFDYDRLGRYMPVCHPGLLHRRSLFETYGLFDNRYKITGDLDFLLRLPRDVRTMHVETVSVEVDVSGVSRRNLLERLREQRHALRNCPRYGLVRAYAAWLDKLWRVPVSRLFGLPI